MIRILAKPKAGNRNAFNGLLYSAIENGGDVVALEWTPARMLLLSYDVLHLHWPDNVLSERRRLRAAAKVAMLLMALAWVRVWGKKVVWTAHNITSHYHFHPSIERVFWRLFIPSLSGIICLSDESLADLRALRKDAIKIPSLVAPHGTYRGAYPNTVTRAEARERLGLGADARVVLNLGIVRSHKKLERLIEVGRERADISALIVGMAREAGYERRLRELARPLGNVHLRLEFVPDDELQYYLNAADVFVLPYDEITNSGSALLALSFGLPILAPDLPYFRALRRRFGEDWVALYEGELDSDKVAGYLARHLEGEGGSCGRVAIDWEGYEWADIAPRVRGFFEDVAAR